MARISTLLCVYVSALVLLAIVAVTQTANAQAGACVPVDEIKRQLSVAGVVDEQVVVMEGAGFVNDYTRHLGVGIPDGSEPIGIIFVILEHTVRFGLIEPQGCVRYHMPVPRVRHSIAFGASRKGV